MRQAILIRSTAILAMSMSPAWAGDVLFNYDFEDGATGFQRVNALFGTVDVEDGAGLNGGKALRFIDGLSTAEAFWNLKSDASAVTGTVLRLSYYNLQPTGAPNQRLYTILTYSDASGANYQAFGTVNNRPNNGVASYEARNFVNGNVTPVAPAALALPLGAYYRVDHFVSLFDTTAPDLPAFTRVLSGNLQTSHASVPHSQVLAPGANYTQREVRAVQLFTFATGGVQYFDDVRAETVNAADIDAIFADVSARVAANLVNDFNNDQAVTLADVTRFVEEILSTRRGDANLDRKVDVTDLGVLASNWQSSAAGWAGGDFTGDGLVDVSDLGELATNWQFGVPTPTAPDSFALAMSEAGLSGVVPEPALAALWIGAVAALTRRRR